MTGYANGNSFAPDSGTGREPRWPVPPWKFGLRNSDDRRSL